MQWWVTLPDDPTGSSEQFEWCHARSNDLLNDLVAVFHDRVAEALPRLYVRTMRWVATGRGGREEATALLTLLIPELGFEKEDDAFNEHADPLDEIETSQLVAALKRRSKQLLVVMEPRASPADNPFLIYSFPSAAHSQVNLGTLAIFGAYGRVMSEGKPFLSHDKAPSKAPLGIYGEYEAPEPAEDSDSEGDSEVDQ